MVRKSGRPSRSSGPDPSGPISPVSAGTSRAVRVHTTGLRVSGDGLRRRSRPRPPRARSGSLVCDRAPRTTFTRRSCGRSRWTARRSWRSRLTTARTCGSRSGSGRCRAWRRALWGRPAGPRRLGRAAYRNGLAVGAGGLTPPKLAIDTSTSPTTAMRMSSFRPVPRCNPVDGRGPEVRCARRRLPLVIGRSCWSLTAGYAKGVAEPGSRVVGCGARRHHHRGTGAKLRSQTLPNRP